MHLSDLHIGKRVNEFSMLEDQKYILNQIRALADTEKVDGVWISGDVYDKTVPSAEAVRLFDDFLTGLVGQGKQVFIISGNHDSPERIAFGARLLDSRGVYLSPVFDGNLAPITLEDRYGKVNLYLLPFLKPAQVRHVFPEAAVESYQDGVALAVNLICGEQEDCQMETDCGDGKKEDCQTETDCGNGKKEDCQMETTCGENLASGERKVCPWDASDRNVLLAHQFVTGAVRCESEELSVGGMDQVSAALFDAFDYVALGHIHNPQSIGRETVRYCGTPLKYSFSEASTEKSVTIVELKEKGNTEVTWISLKPLRDMREIRGTYMELTARENYQGTRVLDYLHVTLTDEEDVPDALGKLRSIYPNIMKLDYDNRRTRGSSGIEANGAVQRKTPLELLEELYELQNNQKMNREQRDFATELIGKIWENREV